MEWSEYLSKLIDDEKELSGITLSIDAGSTITDIPPIVKASVSMMDRMLKKQGNLQVIVFPEKNQSAFIFSLVFLIQNIISGKIKQDYDPTKFVIGEKLKLGNAIVEYAGIETSDGFERICIRTGNNMVDKAPIEFFPVFQKTNTKRKISSDAKYLSEKNRLKDRISSTSGENNVLSILSQYKTHMTSSIYCVTTVASAKEQISDCSLCGKKLTQLLLLSTADYEGKIKNLGPGQAAGIPAIIYASDLYALSATIDNNPKPQAVLIDVSNSSSIAGQLDELDALIKQNIPVICLTDIANSFDLGMLKAREFNIWRWDASNITNQLYDVSNLNLDKKVKFCAKREIEYIKVQGSVISDAIKKISVHRRETKELSAQIMKVYSFLYNLSFSALHTIVPFEEFEINQAIEHLEECTNLLVKEKSYISEQLYSDYYDATELLKKVYNYDFHFTKIEALKEYLQGKKHCSVGIIIPERANKKTISEYWRLWSLRTAVHINSTVLFPGEYYSAGDLGFDLTIIVGWLKRAIMRKILYSFNTQKYVILLYEYENQWQKYAIGKWHNSLKISDNNEIIEKSFSTTDFSVSTSNYIMPEAEQDNDSDSGEDEQEDIELVLRENTFRRYTNNRNSAETVEAIPVSYVGGYIAFYRTGHKLISATPIISHNKNNVKLVLPEELTIGEFIVVRESDKDIIRELADSILEKSGKTELRTIAGKWKEVLEIEMLFITKEEFCKRMVKAGCTKGPATIKRWIEDEEIIAPQQKQDLQYMAEVTQSELLKEMLDQIYDASKEVKSAHTKAGRILSEQLKRNLAVELKNYGEIDPFNFWEPIEMEIDRIGTIKILKVIDLGNIAMVDASDTNHLIDE